MNIRRTITISLLILSITGASLLFAFADTALIKYREAEKKEALIFRKKGNITEKKIVPVAELYRAVYTKYPHAKIADDALFKEARLYEKLYRIYLNAKYFETAVELYKKVLSQYPKSSWADDAIYLTALLMWEKRQVEPALNYLTEIQELFPGTNGAREAQILMKKIKNKDSEANELKGNRAFVKNIRHWTGERYTRVVIDLTREVKYNYGILNDPDRLFIDIEPALVTKEMLTQKFEINQGFLQGIRVGQFSGSIGRIVLDFDKIKKFNIFNLNEPFRLVVDIFSDSHESVNSMARVKTEESKSVPKHVNEKEETITTEKPAGATESNKETEATIESKTEIKTASETEEEIIAEPNVNSDGTYSLARQLGLGVKKIVIDPGHGGKDPGAIGVDGIKEKEVVLSVALNLAEYLKQDGYAVYLTRDKDVFLSLEERTARANSLEADLFISIHANANRNKKLMGIETYYLNFAVSAEEMEVAARENATSQKSIGELQKLIRKIMLDSKIKESRDFATAVHRQLVSAIKAHYPTNDLGVKKAPFYVLIGAQMPAVLLEVSFVSNKIEARRLAETNYKTMLALGIKKGIITYGQDLGGQAFLRSSTP